MTLRYCLLTALGVTGWAFAAAAQGPELASRNGKGWGQAVAYNLSGAARSPNGLSAAASPGQEVALSGARFARAARVFIAGKPAQSRVSRTADTDEMVFRIPEDAPEGCAVPVEVRASGYLPSNMVSIAVRRGGGECRDAEFIPFSHWPGSRAGLVLLTRTSAGEGAVPIDRLNAWFVKLGTADIPIPPPGTCTSRVSDDARGGAAAPSLLNLLTNAISASLLDAGAALKVNDGKTLRRVPAQLLRGVYALDLAGPRIAREPLRLTDLHAAGDGGADVGAFQCRLRQAEPLILLSPITEVDRAHGLTVRWRAVEDAAVIALTFGDSQTQTHGVCFCVAAPGADALAIAPERLARFPAIAQGSNTAQATFTIASWPGRPALFQAPGLDHGLAASSFVSSRTVAIR